MPIAAALNGTGRMLRRSFLLLFAAAGAAFGDEPRPAPVTVAPVVHAPMTSRTELTASVTARRDSRLSARTSGLILEMKVEEGHRVKEGDVLMSLDAELARLALERAQAERAQAQAQLAEAERLLGEAQTLAKEGSSSRSEAATRQGEVRAQTAAVERFEAQVREQAALVERHQLIAPFDGVISRKLTEVGEWVQTGTPVVELVETGHLRVDVQAPQEMFASLQSGETEVHVRLDAYPGRELPAKVIAQVPVKDATARTFLVRLEIDDPKRLAAPGMSGRAIFQIKSEEPVWQVPRDAVVRSANGTVKVWIVKGRDDAATAHSREVKLGNSLADQVEVREGVAGESAVVVRGNEALREGQRVQILSSQPTAGR